VVAGDITTQPKLGWQAMPISCLSIVSYLSLQQRFYGNNKHIDTQINTFKMLIFCSDITVQDYAVLLCVVLLNVGACGCKSCGAKAWES
jgi:hypothetical protein